MRLPIRDKDGPRREPGEEHPVIDGRNRTFTATIKGVQPIAGGYVQYDVEVSPECNSESGGLARFARAVEELEDGRLRCEKLRVSDGRLEQCTLDRAHPEPHQFE